MKKKRGKRKRRGEAGGREGGKEHDSFAVCLASEVGRETMGEK